MSGLFIKRRFYDYVIVIFIILISAQSCSKNIDGTYKSVTGDCYKNLIIKSLGDVDYNIILFEQENDKVDILGKRDGQIISSTLGADSLNFIVQDDMITLFYKEKICKYEKGD